MNEVSKFGGAWAARLTSRFLPLSFLIETWYSKLVFALPRSDGSFGSSESFAGRSLASVTATGRLIFVPCPSALTVSVWVPIGALAGTSSRSCSDTLPLVAGIAAATGWPPPSSVAVHPDGTPSTLSASRSGAWP